MSAWVDGRFSTWTRALDGCSIRLSVRYDSVRTFPAGDPRRELPYVASFNGNDLVRAGERARFKEREDAMRVVERYARKRLSDALADLGTEPDA